MRTIFSIVIALVFLAGAGVIISKGGTAVPVTSPATSKSYTLAEVKKHSTPADCWTAINGEVYNVTIWISEHPGGADAIISLCGIDGSSAFNEEHGGEKRPANELANFKIGALAK